MAERWFNVKAISGTGLTLQEMHVNLEQSGSILIEQMAGPTPAMPSFCRATVSTGGTSGRGSPAWSTPSAVRSSPLGKCISGGKASSGGKDGRSGGGGRGAKAALAKERDPRKRQRVEHESVQEAE